MECPACGAPMTTLTLEGRLGASVAIDVCRSCQAFWFDQYESLHLSPAGTLKVFSLISDARAAGKPSGAEPFACPRCRGRLTLTHDWQLATPFQYWRCEAEHGRFIGFVDFLKEKDFVRPLTGKQLAHLRDNIRTVSCASCGAPIDLVKQSTCPHCGSPVTILDMQQMTDMVAKLKAADGPKSVDPTLPLRLAEEKAAVERKFAEAGQNRGASLIDAGLSLFLSWLKS